MMTAKQDIIVDLRMPSGGIVRCTISVPYWWEEQECKRRSIIRDRESGQMYMDRANLHRRLVDLFLESVEVNGNSRVKESERSWSRRLKHNIIKPLNDAYEKMCSEEMLNFKDEVEMFLSPDKRPEGTFVAPPEVIEYLMMKRIGGLSRQDIRSMSYVEMHKFQIVGNLMAGKIMGITPGPMQAEKGSGMPPGLIHSDILGDPNLSPEQVRMMSDMFQAAASNP